MYCSECGNKIKENALFCSNCGFKVRKKNIVDEEIIFEKPIASKVSDTTILMIIFGTMLVIEAIGFLLF